MFRLRKLYAEQMFVFLRIKRMQLRNHADTQPVKRFQGWMDYAIYTYRIKFIMLEVHENGIALRNCLVVLRNCAVAQLKGNTGPRL